MQHHPPPQLLWRLQAGKGRSRVCTLIPFILTHSTVPVWFQKILWSTSVRKNAKGRLNSYFQSHSVVLRRCAVMRAPIQASALKAWFSQKREINNRWLGGDLTVSSSACPQWSFHNKAWWGTHAVTVVTQNSSHIFPTTDQNDSRLRTAAVVAYLPTFS